MTAGNGPSEGRGGADDAPQSEESEELWAGFQSDDGTRSKDRTPASPSQTAQMEDGLMSLPPSRRVDKGPKLSAVTITEVF